MTPEQARWVRVLRVELGCTFVRIGELLQYAAPDICDTRKGILARYALGGRAVLLAAQVLGESIEDWEQKLEQPKVGG
jgi:hypothetical protein